MSASHANQSYGMIKVIEDTEEDDPDFQLPVEMPKQKPESFISNKRPCSPSKAGCVAAAGDDAICKRTRSNHPLTEVSLEELEAALNSVDADEEEFLFEDDEGVYQKFLAMVQVNPEDLEELLEEDEDDDDVDYEDLDPTAAVLAANYNKAPKGASGRRAASRRTQEARLAKETPVERALGSTEMVTKRLLKPLRHRNVPAAGPVAVTRTCITDQQMNVLHRQLNDHCQLLVQVYAHVGRHAAWQGAAAKVHGLLVDMLQTFTARLAVKQREQAAPQLLHGSSVSVMTVLDVAPTRMLPDFFADMSAVAMPEACAVTDTPQSSDTGKGEKSGRVAVIPELPPGVAVALSRFFPVFDKALSVQPTTRLKGAPQSIFTPAEDALLALGIRRYGLQWPRIQQVLLPAKTVQQVFIRQKNCCAARTGHNAIKDAKLHLLAPLSATEVAIVKEGLQRFGPSSWEKVVTNCLPARDPSTLARLYRRATSENTKPASLESRVHADHRPVGEFTRELMSIRSPVQTGPIRSSLLASQTPPVVAAAAPPPQQHSPLLRPVATVGLPAPMPDRPSTNARQPTPSALFSSPQAATRQAPPSGRVRTALFPPAQLSSPPHAQLHTSAPTNVPVQPPSSRAVTRSSSISQSAAIDPFLQNEPADFESQQEVVAAAVATLGALKAAGSTETAFTRKAAEPLNKRPRTTKSSKPGTTQSQRCPPPMEPHKRAAPHSPVTTRHSCAPCVTVVAAREVDGVVENFEAEHLSDSEDEDREGFDAAQQTPPRGQPVSMQSTTGKGEVQTTAIRNPVGCEMHIDETIAFEAEDIPSSEDEGDPVRAACSTPTLPVHALHKPTTTPPIQMTSASARDRSLVQQDPKTFSVERNERPSITPDLLNCTNDGQADAHRPTLEGSAKSVQQSVATSDPSNSSLLHFDTSNKTASKGKPTHTGSSMLRPTASIDERVAHNETLPYAPNLSTQEQPAFACQPQTERSPPTRQPACGSETNVDMPRVVSKRPGTLELDEDEVPTQHQGYGNDALVKEMCKSEESMNNECDAVMEVDGKMTVWGPEDDRRILMACLSLGPTEATFSQLAQHLADASIHHPRTERHVRLRFQWLFRRMNTHDV